MLYNEKANGHFQVQKIYIRQKHLTRVSLRRLHRLTWVKLIADTLNHFFLRAWRICKICLRHSPNLEAIDSTSNIGSNP